MKNSILFKSLSVLLCLMLMLPFAVSAFAAGGTGTASDPYIISTVSALQNINNNLSAHYKLGANINLSGVDFTPIGNASAGTFTGSFDGNGYTISNLSVYAGKYSALFGVNEGTVKNVKLSNIDVYGTRYVAGVCAYNSAAGTLESCSVLSGKVVTDGGVTDCNAAGICAYNAGAMTGKFSNSANVTAKNTVSKYTYAGGIIGYCYSEIELTGAENSGTVSSSFSFSSSSSSSSSYSYSYSGGMIGRASSTATLTSCTNSGTVSSSSSSYSYSYSGGMIGRASSTATLTSCTNSGTVSSSSSSSYSYSYSGGMIGYASSTATLTNCSNNGGISSSADIYSYSGGMIGCAYRAATLTNCTNSGNVSSSISASQAHSFSGGMIGCASSTTSLINCTNTGRIFSGSLSGGMIGYVGSTVNLTNCNNNGSVGILNHYSDSGSGGMIGRATSTATLTNCINSGSDNRVYTLSMIGYNSTGNTKNCINIGNINRIFSNGSSVNCFYLSGSCNPIDGVTALNAAQMKSQSSFTDFDFNEVWVMDSRFNSGYPYLKNDPNPLKMNVLSKQMIPGETLQLYVYKNNSLFTGVTYSSDSTSVATVTSGGLIKAVGNGIATITAVDAQGNKINCSVRVLTDPQSVSHSDISLAWSNERSISPIFASSSNDFVVEASSSRPDIASVYTKSGTYYVKANALGTAVVSFKTALGYTASFTVSVYATAVSSISVSPTSTTLACGASAKLTATCSPTVYTGVLTWSSNDTSVVTVDGNGIIKAVGTGSATVTVSSSNGKTATCKVTVTTPVSVITTDSASISVYAGETCRMGVTCTPENAINSVSWSSSDNNVATVDSSGLITGVSGGKCTVTVTSPQGGKATFTVNVLTYKVAVTGVTLNYTEKALTVGDDCAFTATVSPSNATEKEITWASTDETVAKVSSTGTVTAVGAGQAMISASTSNGVYAACIVTVTSPVSGTADYSGYNAAKAIADEISNFDMRYTAAEFAEFKTYVNNIDSALNKNLADTPQNAMLIFNAKNNILNAISNLENNRSIFVDLYGETGLKIKRVAVKKNTTVAEAVSSVTPSDTLTFKYLGWVYADGTAPAYEHIITEDVSLYLVGEKKVIEPESGSGIITGLENRFILNINPGLTGANLVKMLANDTKQLVLSSYNGQYISPNAKLCTGDKITLQSAYTGEVYETRCVVIEGDVDGDGEVTVNDYQQAVNIALGDDNDLSDEPDNPYLKAADISGDGFIDVIDIAYLERRKN